MKLLAAHRLRMSAYTAQLPENIEQSRLRQAVTALEEKRTPDRMRFQRQQVLNF